MNAGGFRRSARRRAAGFVQIPNDVVRDCELSGRARGVLGYLLSHADGFVVTRARLHNDFPEGRDAMDTALRELREAGYVRAVREHGDDGKFVGGGYLVFDERGAADTDDDPGDGETTSRETRGTDNPAPYKNTNSDKNTSSKEHQSNVLDETYERFRLEWRAVGVWQAGPKVKARLRALMKAGKIADVFAGLERLAADPNRPEPMYVPRPLTWLNGERWADDPYPPRQGASAAAGRVMGIDVGEIPAAAAKPAEIEEMNWADGGPRSNTCPACQAPAGVYCSQPTSTGRTTVAWEHEARIHGREAR